MCERQDFFFFGVSLDYVSVLEPRRPWAPLPAGYSEVYPDVVRFNRRYSAAR